MKTTRFGAAACGALLCALAAVPEARTASSPMSAVDSMAMHEMLEGKSGHREMWQSTPSLVVIATVLDYEHGDMTSGFPALDQQLNGQDIVDLTSDLTVALDELTDGTITEFRSISIEKPQPGSPVRIVRPGQIVVARFSGIRAVTGNLGFGGRLTRSTSIIGAAILLDAGFDTESTQRNLLRTHELGHALGYNHVDSRPSVMNPRVGVSITDFDRAAIHAAFDPDAQH